MTAAMHNHNAARSVSMLVIPDYAYPDEVEAITCEELYEAFRHHNGHALVVEDYGHRIVCTECQESLMDL